MSIIDTSELTQEQREILVAMQRRIQRGQRVVRPRDRTEIASASGWTIQNLEDFANV